ncbi:hypothetical protein ACFL35_12855 [Candidatus Riflebacteria bacterium]
MAFKSFNTHMYSSVKQKFPAIKKDLSGQGRVLRFGIICNGKTLEKWQAECVQNILALGFTQLQLLIIDDGSWAEERSLKNTPMQKWLYFFYRKTWFLRAPRRHVKMKKLFCGVETIQPRIVMKGKFSQYFDRGALGKIRAAKLDFILRFGFNIIRGKILESARFGVWSFHHDDEMKYRGSPAGFWEIFHDDPIQGGILQRITDRLDGGIVLKRGYLNTIRHSYIRNLKAIYNESATWPAQVCRDIFLEQADYFKSEATKTAAKIYYPPQNMEMLSFWLKIVWRRLTYRFNKLFKKDKWNIGVVNAPIEKFLEKDFSPRVAWVKPEIDGKFLADPFPIMPSHPQAIPTKNDNKNRYIVLFEYFDYKKGRANIACAELYDDMLSSKVDNIHNAISTESHLSYPYTFACGSEIYCIPETYQNNEVALYRAVELPDRWEKIATLIKDFAGVDATIFHYRENWWILVTDRFWGSKYNLFLFYSRDLFGPYKPHPQNPVKTDIRCSRPAGTPFFFQNQLYRPVQDCSITYGGKLAINRIIEITEKIFSEELVKDFFPVPPFNDGLHTLVGWGEKTLVDGKYSCFKWNL